MSETFPTMNFFKPESISFSCGTIFNGDKKHTKIQQFRSARRIRWEREKGGSRTEKVHLMFLFYSLGYSAQRHFCRAPHAKVGRYFGDVVIPGGCKSQHRCRTYALMARQRARTHSLCQRRSVRPKLCERIHTLRTHTHCCIHA